MSISTSNRQASGDQRIAFYATWEFYQAMARTIGDQPIRLAFDGERIELMSPGPLHEKDRSRLERLVSILTEERAIPCISMGSTRWECPEAWRGIEADATFYLTATKVEAARVRSKDIRDYPVPDLAIEIDHSATKIDRDSIYVALGVPEVWLYDGEEIIIHRLADDGTYIEVDASLPLVIRSEDLTYWIQIEALDDNDWARKFREWTLANPVDHTS
jgi:Uma2 family endonuclease